MADDYDDFLREEVINHVRRRRGELRNKAKQALTLKEHDVFAAQSGVLEQMEKDLNDHWMVHCRQARRALEKHQEEA